MMMMMMKSVYLCFLLLGLAAAFSPTTTPKQNRRRRVSSSSVQLIPGLDPVDAAIAIVSAAAGAATQFSRVQSLEKDLVSAAAGAATQSSRVQSLEKDLDATRSALALSQLEQVDKVSQLEEQLFRLDEEFENESGKIQKQFDHTLREKLEDVRKKAKEEYQFTLDIKLLEEREQMRKEAKEEYEFTLDIKVLEERGKMLAEKLDFVGSVNGDKDIELVNLRLQQTQVEMTNKKLENALTASEAEMDRIQGLKKGKKGWWPF